ncbi:hypothetical protein Mgra_00005194 [Meloidogyne graminicola]|uniref:Uncharacterized protein n=1 Tax=Meloidogyne graminicola TaxID=189291 RepID=A0A8S9ZPK1_9BILA|nr:hypothetical protein Mgra_00005194 [Meloidogyne graminicola]
MKFSILLILTCILAVLIEFIICSGEASGSGQQGRGRRGREGRGRERGGNVPLSTMIDFSRPNQGWPNVLGTSAEVGAEAGEGSRGVRSRGGRSQGRRGRGGRGGAGSGRVVQELSVHIPTGEGTSGQTPSFPFIHLPIPAQPLSFRQPLPDGDYGPPISYTDTNLVSSYTHPRQLPAPQNTLKLSKYLLMKKNDKEMKKIKREWMSKELKKI